MNLLRPESWWEIQPLLTHHTDTLDLVWVYEQHLKNPWPMLRTLLEADDTIVAAMCERASRACHFTMLKDVLTWAEKYNQSTYNQTWAHVEDAALALQSTHPFLMRQEFVENVANWSAALNEERKWCVEHPVEYVIFCSSVKAQKWDVLNAWLLKQPNPQHSIMLMLEDWATSAIPTISVKDLEDWFNHEATWGLFQPLVHILEQSDQPICLQEDLLGLPSVQAYRSREGLRKVLSSSLPQAKPKVM